MTRAKKKNIQELFELKGQVAVITGGAGFLGKQHSQAIFEAGGIPIMVDIDAKALQAAKKYLKQKFDCSVETIRCDITKPTALKKLVSKLDKKYGRIDILINNAANNPKMEDKKKTGFSNLENFPLKQWEADIKVGLTGVFLCSQIIGTYMAKKKRGVIINMASNLGMVSPDQRIYKKKSVPKNKQIVKPVTYSAVKGALINLTRYLATYWAEDGVRVNSISPGGMENGQAKDFVKKYSSRVPMNRMAQLNEYQGSIIFLCSDASSYMNGANLVVDGGWTAW